MVDCRSNFTAGYGFKLLFNWSVTSVYRFMHRRKLLLGPKARKGDIDPPLLYYGVEHSTEWCVLRLFSTRAVWNTSGGPGSGVPSIPITGYKPQVPGACRV